ncbi:hypothetical protein [Actinokineospora sp. NPDC004072]
MTHQRHVRLMSDYGVGWPLWDDGGAMDRSAVELSEALTARLGAWQQHFEERFHHETGWRSAPDAAKYAEEGKELHRLLTDELAGHARVELDLWPVQPEQGGPPRR